MTLIIAEKPSLARNIASAVESMTGKNTMTRIGYIECGQYLITYALGHLFSLADVEYYSPAPEGKSGWSMNNLPCFPKNFEYMLRDDKGVIKQFGIIRSLCLRDDVDSLVNAGDSDREGEIIIRTCVGKALPKGHGKIFNRLWLPDQTPETIKKALMEMKPESEYDRLAAEGYARTFIDWLYGINLTRYATLRTGAFLRVGRVIIPIVKAVYDRDMAIKNFVSEKYYSPLSKEITGGEEIELLSRKKFDASSLADAQKLCARYNMFGAVVSSVKKKRGTISPGKLFSLTKLQNFLGKKYKMSMETSLAALQKLYEAGYVTYPRTNSEYLATAEKDKIKTIISNIAGIGYPVEFKDTKNIFDDTKIEAHSALTPTFRIPDKNKLEENEQKVYSAIFRRFVAVFCSEECAVDRTEIKITVGDPAASGEDAGEEFILKGTVVIKPGWTKYDDGGASDKLLPPFKKGDTVNIDFKPAEKETSPPKHYTIETLNNYLKNPFKKEIEEKTLDTSVLSVSDEAVSDDDTEDYRAIFEGLELGTEATRTGIINNAVKSKYIKLNKDVYTILPDGIYLMEAMARLGIGMDKYKTASLGRALKKVYRGEMRIAESVAFASSEISEVFSSAPSGLSDTDVFDGFFGDIAGKCPLCGRDVIRTRYGYGCSGYKEGCKFHIGGTICGRVISLSNARLLLETGHTAKITGFVSRKTGKTFCASLCLKEGKAVFDFSSALPSQNVIQAEE